METNDPLEIMIAEALRRRGIDFIHESRGKEDTRSLDFYAPAHDLFIEVTAFHTPRKIEQLSRVQNVILIQGAGAAKAFAEMLGREEM